MATVEHPEELGLLRDFRGPGRLFDLDGGRGLEGRMRHIRETLGDRAGMPVTISQALRTHEHLVVGLPAPHASVELIQLFDCDHSLSKLHLAYKRAESKGIDPTAVIRYVWDMQSVAAISL